MEFSKTLSKLKIYRRVLQNSRIFSSVFLCCPVNCIIEKRTASCRATFINNNAKVRDQAIETVPTRYALSGGARHI